MTRKDALDWLYRLRSEMYVYMPKVWLFPMNDALDIAINSLEIDERYELEYEQIEPCDDAISRQAVLDMVEDMTDQFGNKHRVVTEGMISLLPPVTPKPKTDVLDKIRAEILNFKEKCNAGDYLGCGILEIIDKYKAESETEKDMPKYCDDCVLLGTDGCSMGGSAKGCEACDDFMTEREVEE